MKRILGYLIGLGIIGAGVGWVLTAPTTADEDEIAGLTGDAARGEMVFHAAGCASCHAAPGSEDKLTLVGGMEFASPFGTFVAPNISQDPTEGIGAWTTLDLVTAMQHGTSPEGTHYYPAFPYASYIRADVADIVDLHAYLKTLPADATPSQPHDVGFPFNIRRSLGGWKLLFLDEGWVVDPGDLSDEETRGRELVEALGHCGECHTPRNALGGPDTSRWLAGAPYPTGKGSFPNITPAALEWSSDEIVEYLTSGFTPEFDSVGGHMAEVVENFAQLPEAERAAVAAYLNRVAPSE